MKHLLLFVLVFSGFAWAEETKNESHQTQIRKPDSKAPGQGANIEVLAELRRAEDFLAGVTVSIDFESQIKANKALNDCVSKFNRTFKRLVLDPQVLELLAEIKNSYVRLSSSEEKVDQCKVGASLKPADNNKSGKSLNFVGEFHVACGKWLEYTGISFRSDLRGGRCEFQKEILSGALKTLDVQLQGQEHLNFRE